MQYIYDALNAYRAFLARYSFYVREIADPDDICLDIQHQAFEYALTTPGAWRGRRNTASKP